MDTGACTASLQMILSMTGFAAAAAELPGISLAVELRSVNHRYLDVTLKLPDELRMLEPAVRERLAARSNAASHSPAPPIRPAGSPSTSSACDSSRTPRRRLSA